MHVGVLYSYFDFENDKKKKKREGNERKTNQVIRGT